MMKSEDYHHHQQNVIIPNSTQQNTPSTQIYQTYHPHPSYLSHPPHFISPPPHYNTETTPPLKKPKHTPTTSSEECGGTIELSRRPRGRPPGSKNKPKPAIVITTSSSQHPPMSPYILELPPNSDLVDSLTRLTRCRRVSLCVLNATGAVNNVTLKQPPTATGTVTFHGRFDILSLSACILCSNPTSTTRMDDVVHAGWVGGFTISLAGPQGQIVGGKVVGPLVCAGTVYVVATSFNNPSYCKLPLGDEDEVEEGKNEGEYYNGRNCEEEDRVVITSGGGGENMRNMVNYG